MTYADVLFAPMVGQEAAPDEGNQEEAAAFAPVAQEAVPGEGEPAEAPAEMPGPGEPGDGGEEAAPQE